VLDYDREAARYDATRGGDARADAAAHAIEALLPAENGTRIADVGCGTGIVSVRLVRPGRSVIGIDRSAGMTAMAAGRLPGRIALGNVTRLPLASGSVDAVTMVWLLHLLGEAEAAAAVAEAGRVLSPGGLLITTAAGRERIDALCAELAGLPDQDRARPDPVYQVAALRKG
jgi:ubiquinone/menaquinone biosynthesis C-methylase UbiE